MADVLLSHDWLRTVLKISRLAATFTLICLCCGGCNTRNTPGVIQRSPAEDLYVSYWQLADNFTRELVQAENGDQALDPISKIPRKDPLPVADKWAPIDDLCDELEAYQEELAELTPEEVRQFDTKHSALVEHVQTTVEDLSQKHAAQALIPTDKWNRYRKALQPQITGPSGTVKTGPMVHPL